MKIVVRPKLIFSVRRLFSPTFLRFSLSTFSFYFFDSFTLLFFIDIRYILVGLPFSRFSLYFLFTLYVYFLIFSLSTSFFMLSHLLYFVILFSCYFLSFFLICFLIHYSTNFLTPVSPSPLSF